MVGPGGSSAHFARAERPPKRVDPAERPRRRVGNADKPAFQRGFSARITSRVPPPRQPQRGPHGHMRGRGALSGGRLSVHGAYRRPPRPSYLPFRVYRALFASTPDIRLFSRIHSPVFEPPKRGVAEALGRLPRAGGSRRVGLRPRPCVRPCVRPCFKSRRQSPSPRSARCGSVRLLGVWGVCVCGCVWVCVCVLGGA